MSQVVVEDNRSTGQLPKPYECLESGSIFAGVKSGDVYLKAGDGRALQLTGNDKGKFINCGTEATCYPLPHLRLRMVLETVE